MFRTVSAGNELVLCIFALVYRLFSNNEMQTLEDQLTQKDLNGELEKDGKAELESTVEGLRQKLSVLEADNAALKEQVSGAERECNTLRDGNKRLLQQIMELRSQIAK